jgi:hypothetical protein
MNMPRFTAEESLHSKRSEYAQWQPGRYDGSRIVPQLFRGVTDTKTCASKANDCTNECRPSDSACRDQCDCLFWCCVTGGGVGCLRTVAAFFG